MQSGEYIANRWMVGIIRDICKARGITICSFSDDWVFELKCGEQTARMLGYKFSLNDSVASAIAQDKVAAYELLAAHSIPAAEHFLMRTKVSETNWEQWAWEKGMVVKPLVGTGGHGIKLFNNSQQAHEWVNGQVIEAWTASPYLNIASETRLIMLDGVLLTSYQKEPVIIDNLKMFNLGKGAQPKFYKASADQIKLAKNTQEVLSLRLAAVDIIELETGEQLVLEVNDGVMMENFARSSKEAKAITISIYESIIESLFATDQPC